VLSRGLLSGSKPAASGDFRTTLPRFTGENAARNRQLVEALTGLARARGVTSSQLAIAWVLAQSPSIVPVVGARTRKQLDESLSALAVSLDAAALEALTAAVPSSAVAGDRYGAHQMQALDSERVSR